MTIPTYTESIFKGCPKPLKWTYDWEKGGTVFDRNISKVFCLDDLHLIQRNQISVMHKAASAVSLSLLPSGTAPKMEPYSDVLVSLSDSKYLQY